jgi:hypothetical protein
MAAEMTARLRLDNPRCDCARLRPEVVARGQTPCITELRPLQGWYLWEAAEVGGAVGLIPVGGGKTGIDVLTAMVVPDCDLAVLLIRPSDVKQLLADYRVWSQHFKVPNLVGGPGPWVAGRPRLEVFPYSQASRPENAHWWTARSQNTSGHLVVIADECQKLKDRKASSTSRFLRHFATRPETKFFAHSASFTTRGMDDHCHLTALALREGSPEPLSPSVVEAWAECIDPAVHGEPADPGALNQMCREGEPLERALHRRIVETRGVISTSDVSVTSKLRFLEAHADPPQAIQDALAKVRREEKRPDGEILMDEMEVAAVAMQVVCGFFYYWRFPRGEPEDLIEEWFRRRKEWNAEVRDGLKRKVEGMDSPKLLRDAAERGLSGYRGELPVWRAASLPKWKEIEDRVVPVPAVQWIDDYLARAAAEWARKHVGIVWYKFSAFGRKVAELTGLPRYGEKASKVYNLNATPAMLSARDGKRELGTWDDSPGDWIQVELGERSIVASLNAHGTGKNLQAFHRQLWSNPPADGGAWEQG